MNPLQDEAWLQQRCGKVGASSIWRVMAKTRTGVSAERANYMAEIICERLTGQPTESFKSQAMQDGIDREATARSLYEFQTDVTVQLAGWVPHPMMPDCGASPDGLVGDVGLVEIKCPQRAGHLATLLGGAVPDKYVKQVQWQMACTDRKWCDFVSFNPDFPGDLQLYVERIERDDDFIATAEVEVWKFIQEVEQKIGSLQKLRAAA